MNNISGGSAWDLSHKIFRNKPNMGLGDLSHLLVLPDYYKNQINFDNFSAEIDKIPKQDDKVPILPGP